MIINVNYYCCYMYSRFYMYVEILFANFVL